MRTPILATLAVLLPLAAAEPQFTTLFEANTGGYLAYRIPALAITTKGTLLAFCAARKELGDWAEIGIAMRRSTDGGKNWEPQRIVASRGTMVVDNPVPIIDRQTGAVHFLFQVNYAQLYYMRSDDDGKTFSTPVDITETVHEFRRGWVMNASDSRYGWNVVAPGPGHGLQLASGRLLSTVWMSPNYRHRPSATATIYSDDHGKTWKAGALIPMGALVNPSEHIALELADGRVMTNMRSETGDHLRAISISADGISGWSVPGFQGALFEPVCMASLLRVSAEPRQKRNRIVFTNPDVRTSGQPLDTKRVSQPRQDLRIKLSYDEGKSWPVEKLLLKGGTGYSDMALAKDGTIFVLMEHVLPGAGGKENHNISISPVTLEWLTDGKDRFE